MDAKGAGGRLRPGEIRDYAPAAVVVVPGCAGCGAAVVSRGAGA